VSRGEVFADIAGKYDRINKILSLGQDDNWRRRIIDRLPEGRILDIGAGTGAANRLFGDRDVVALDPSEPMLDLNDAPEKHVGVGESLPFEDASFDAVFSAFVVRNLDSLDDTLAEVARVLKPGGKAGIVDLGRPRNPVARAIHRTGSAVVLTGVGVAYRALAEYRYLDRSLDKLPPPEEMYADTPLVLEHLERMGPLGFVYGVVLAKA
jgi:demethylmenaquinone methyltransferase/2-methoxy-6-polyprenyl-1,4-benzoquinol methylase